MTKLHAILATTLDGFVAREDGGMDWIVMGDERADYTWSRRSRTPTR